MVNIYKATETWQWTIFTIFSQKNVSRGKQETTSLTSFMILRTAGVSGVYVIHPRIIGLNCFHAIRPVAVSSNPRNNSLQNGAENKINIVGLSQGLLLKKYYPKVKVKKINA